MSNIQQMAEGYTQLALSKLGMASHQVEELAAKRLAICLQCPELSKRDTCKICGCYMPSKVRSAKATCPHNPKQW